MTRYRLIAKLLLGTALLAALGAGAVRIRAGETPKKIRILYTDDMSGQLKPCG